MRKPWKLILAIIAVALLLGWLVLSAPKNPVAVVRVVDAAGNGVPGAVIKPEGLRTKPGPYASGWYSWTMELHHVPPDPVITDKRGYAHFQYPKYVTERLETGQLCLAVDHPDFVPERPDVTVTTLPPAGTPWQTWLKYVFDRIQRKALVAHSDPIVLKPGATLRISLRPDSAGPKDTPLFAEITGGSADNTNFWLRPVPDVLLTRRLAPGTPAVRVVRFDTNETPWFSDVITLNAVAAQTNELLVDLKPALAVRGQLDASVPRPVRKGRVIASVWPARLKPSDYPPEWHSWAEVREDGTFEINSLPPGDLEIVALCAGFVSTNGPGKFHMRYPQKHVLATNDLEITVGMEPTARLEVLVLDDHNKPLSGAHVYAWPNVRYGEWFATVLGGDCYRTSDSILSHPGKKRGWHTVEDFEGTSDPSGLAVIPNLPADTTEFGAEHTNFELPAQGTPGGQKNRAAYIKLVPGTNNHATIQLEPRDQSPIAHY